MLLKELALVNHRNYQQTVFKFSPRLNIVAGPNGIGKTNLLEAIYLLARGQSHRTHFSRELIRWGASFSSIRGLVERERGPFWVEITISAQGQKNIKIGGMAQSATSLGDGLAAVLFAPEHLRIVQGDPEQRRAFLDELLVQLSPRYGYERRQYGRILRQRNALLRAIAGGKGSREALVAWNNQLVELGTKILVARFELVAKLKGRCRQTYGEVVKESENDFEVSYVSQLLEGTTLAEAKERFLEKLRARQEEEIERGLSLVGPHRDDLSVKALGVNLRVYGSQGEQRTASLALKLAELRLLTEETGDRPVLLLDDVMSELDRFRRKALTKVIEGGGQTIVTTTNLGYFGGESLEEARLIDVEKIGISTYA